jgi:hypothetical protein
VWDFLVLELELELVLVLVLVLEKPLRHFSKTPMYRSTLSGFATTAEYEDEFEYEKRAWAR